MKYSVLLLLFMIACNCAYGQDNCWDKDDEAKIERHRYMRGDSVLLKKIYATEEYKSALKKTEKEDSVLVMMFPVRFDAYNTNQLIELRIENIERISGRRAFYVLFDAQKEEIISISQDLQEGIFRGMGAGRQVDPKFLYLFQKQTPAKK